MPSYHLILSIGKWDKLLVIVLRVGGSYPTCRQGLILTIFCFISSSASDPAERFLNNPLVTNSDLNDFSSCLEAIKLAAEDHLYTN